MRVCALVGAVVLLLAPGAAAEPPASLEHGYRLMYGLDFASASRAFTKWRAAYPSHPLGPMSEAASLFFAELVRSGILQAQFFVDDASFTDRKPSAPPPDLRARFDAKLAEAEGLARSQLRQNDLDRDALFALATINGLRADYAALIEGRGMAALSYTHQATLFARKLLAVAPDYADAYLSTGINHYIVGSLVPPLRWILRFAGYAGDKARGMADLHVAADRGRLLGPFARIVLAIAYLRERDTTRARDLLAGLAREFPSNTLFARELRRIDGKAH